MIDKILNWCIARVIQAKFGKKKGTNMKQAEMDDSHSNITQIILNDLPQECPPPPRPSKEQDLDINASEQRNSIPPPRAGIAQKRKGIVTTDDWDDKSAASFMTIANEKSYDKKKKSQPRMMSGFQGRQVKLIFP